MPHTVAFVFAHPDDETFMCACLIRQLADRGEKPLLLLATNGDAGKTGYLGPMTKEQLAAKRVQEMETAAQIMGLAGVEYLAYPDGKLNTINKELFTDKVVSFLNREQAEVVVTFPPNGGNGHPDHIAISDIARRAVISGRCPTVQKLYYTAFTVLPGAERSISFSIDTEAQWSMKSKALQAHESQLLSIHRVFGDLIQFPEERRYESFVLAWERGVFYPPKKERFILDDLV